MVTITTEGVAAWADQVHPQDTYLDFARNRGRRVLRFAGIDSVSDDLAILAYHCWRGMSELLREGRISDDYIVAGEVLDGFVTDHDAELLAEVEPEVRLGGVVGGMTEEATAVHELLLRIVGALREKWESDDVL